MSRSPSAECELLRGEIAAMREELVEAERENDDLRAQRDALDAKLVAEQERTRAVQNVLNFKNRTITRVQAELAEANAKITRLQHRAEQSAIQHAEVLRGE